ncbi:MAG: phosphate acetyltransferase [Balneolaceae bacterium]
MDIINHIRNSAKKNPKRIVLPRSSDPRVIEATNYLHNNDICEVILLANEGKNDYPKGVEIINTATDSRLEQYAEAYYSKRKHKGISQDEAYQIVQDPLYFATSMVAEGDADGCVAGSVSTTGDVLRSALQVIGLKKGSNVVSSTFLMSFPDGKVYTFGDCAVVPYPNAAQLATIAQDSARTHQQLVNEEPHVALLSFSTKGSSKYEGIELIKEALKLVKENNSKLSIDGELQFDAALIESIGKSKAPNSTVAGRANVFIFPNLDAGNIAYKITERLAGATATGPIIQGLAKPVMDLSRGCSWEDIVNTVSVCSLMGNLD